MYTIESFKSIKYEIMSYYIIYWRHTFCTQYTFVYTTRIKLSWIFKFCYLFKMKKKCKFSKLFFTVIMDKGRGLGFTFQGGHILISIPIYGSLNPTFSAFRTSAHPFYRRTCRFPRFPKGYGPHRCRVRVNNTRCGDETFCINHLG